MLRRPVFLILLMCALAGCNHPDPNVFREQTQFNDAHMLIAASDLRIITERSRQLTSQPGAQTISVYCSEPSPDVATALSTALKLSGSGGVAGGASGSASTDYSASEQLSLLAGRSSGVIALRDGLYYLCQNFASGILGVDAYALSLSQYGDLLVKLASSSGGDTGGGAPKSAGSTGQSAPGVTIAVAGAGSTPGATVPPTPLTPAKDQGSGGTNSGAQTILQALLVACINEYDQTRLIPIGSQGPMYNPVLDKTVCQNLVKNLVAAMPDLLKQQAGNQKQAAATKQQTAAEIALIKSVQNALQQPPGSYYKGAIDGKLGPQTKQALEQYQKANPPLRQTGQADPDTLAKLGIKQPN